MIRKNVAGQFVHIAGVNVSTGAVVTGATWTMRRCLDGTFAAGGATVTEDGTTGFYKVALAQADTNANNIGYFFTATNCVPVTLNVITTACDPTSTAFGLVIAKTTNITGFNDITATDVVSSGAITTSGGAVSTVTTLTNLPAITANWLTAAGMAADASAEIADAVWDEDATGHQTGGTFGQAIGDPGADTTTIYQSVVTDATGTNVAADIIAMKVDTAAILVDTGTTLDGRIPAALVGGRMDANVGAISADSVAADNAEAFFDGTGYAGTGNVIPTVTAVTGLTAATVHSDLDDIQARLPAALTAGGNMKADVLAISGSTVSADNLEESTEAIAYGTVDGTGATTTSFLSSALTPDSSVNDQFNGRVLIFKDDTSTAALKGQATTISDYAHTSAEIGTFTVVALTTAPATGDTFVIL